MRLFFILFLFLLLILFIPIKFKTKIIYNLIKNKGYVSLYFYNINLMVSKWKFLPFKITVKNKKWKKDKTIYFNNTKKENEYGDIFLSELIKKLKLSNFRTYINFGFCDNCLITALSGGLFKIGIGVLNSFLINANKAFYLDSQIFCDFEKSKTFFCVTTSVKINLFSIVYCLLASLFIKFSKES